MDNYKTFDEMFNKIVSPEESKECYACTFMIQSVSKKRLSRYGNTKKGYYDIKLSNEQMKRVCNNLSQIAYNSIEKAD